MEYVSTVRGVEFINDSKATNVNSTWFALESMQKPVILILGGIDKGNDYSLIRRPGKRKSKSHCMHGRSITGKFMKHFKTMCPLIVNTSSATEAVKSSFHLADKG